MIQDLDANHVTDEHGHPAGGTTHATGLDITWQAGKLVDDDGERLEPNGAFVETVIAAALDRLRYYQDSGFACAENADAIAALELGLTRLHDRTARREYVGIEGTHGVDPAHEGTSVHYVSTGGTVTDGVAPDPVDDAAQALIGAMLLSTAAIDAARTLTPTDFPDVKLALLWSSINLLDEDGIVVDPVTVAEHLQSTGMLATEGHTSAQGLLRLQANCPATSSAGTYVDILKSRRPMGTSTGIRNEPNDRGL